MSVNVSVVNNMGNKLLVYRYCFLLAIICYYLLMMSFAY